jgi:primosomal protein N'
MSKVRFASICDDCGSRSDEYVAFPICRVCGDDVCTHCGIESMRDDETGRTTCHKCFLETL